MTTLSQMPRSTATTRPSKSEDRDQDKPVVTTYNPSSIDFVLKSLLAGGVAGMCAKTTVAPLDRMKILLQAHNEHYKNLGPKASNQ